MPKFRVTYQVVTEESAQDGNFAEHGYALPGGYKFSIKDVSARPNPISDYEMSLREAIGISVFPEDSGNWFSSVDGEMDYRTGDVTTYALHPPRNITKASYARLKRLLT